MAALSAPIAVGLVGAGIVAEQHLAALRQLEAFTVRAVNDLDRGAADRIAAAAGSDVAGSLEELVDRVDLVVVTTPHGSHAELAIAAMQAGRHVLVEKPMATTVADCDRMIATAEEHGVLLWPGQQQRHYPGVRAAKEVLASGELGPPVLYLDRRDGDYRADREIRRWQFNRRLAGGGIAMTLGVHVVDRMLWLLDTTATAIQGGCAVPNGFEVESAAYGQIRLASGPPTSFMVDGTGPAGGHHTTVICADGHLTISDDATVVTGPDSTRRISLPAEKQYPDSFVGQYQALASSLLDGAEPAITAVEGRTAVAVVEALYASARDGGRQVPIG